MGNYGFAKKLLFETKVILGIAFVLLIVGGYSLGLTFYAVNNYELTSGRVVELEKEGLSIKLPVVEFRDKNGKLLEVKSINRVRADLEEEVFVYYNPKNSEDLYIKDVKTQYVDGGFLLVGAVAFVFIARKFQRKVSISEATKVIQTIQ